MKISLIFLFFCSLAYAEPVQIGPIDFGRAVNDQTDVTNILDNESSDMCNCISNSDGSMVKRFGSEPFVEQPRSSHSVDALYRAYASTGSYSRAITIAVIGDQIVYSTGDTNSVWITLSSAINLHQNWSFTTINDSVIMTGDGLVNPIYRFNIITSSFAPLVETTLSTDSINVRAKYVAQKNNYLLLGNVALIDTSTQVLTQGTTYYPSRIYYSLLNSPLNNLAISSYAWNRFLDFRTSDINSLDVIFDRVIVGQQNAIQDLSFSVLSPGTGDQAISELVSGFGVVAPRSAINTGQFLIFASQDGIRRYDGGRRSRITSVEESRIISNNIKTLITRLIKAGTYKNIVGHYYKKKEYYILSYEDPDKFPKGINNSVIVYDIRLDQWYPFCGLLAKSFTSFDDPNGTGQLLYGESVGGRVHKLDVEEQTDDSPKNLVVDTMDLSSQWVGTRVNRDITNVIEGTGSVRMWINSSVTESSMTRMNIFSIGEWYDKTKISKDDYLSFQIYTTSIGNITNLRVDLEVNDESQSAFDTNFTSVTITSGVLNTSNNIWTQVRIQLSSFPVRSDWTDLDSEEIPFADTLSYYGIRFVVNGINISSISIDNIRIVQEKDRNPVNFYRFVKLFNFGTMAHKKSGQLLLTMEKSPDSELSIDVYNDFGNKVTTRKFERTTPREIIVLGLVSTASIAIVDDIDYSVIQSTTFNESDYLPLNGTANKDFIFFSDRTNNRLVKFDRSPFGVILSTFGSLGSGTTNFNIAHQHAINENNELFLVDMMNERVKVHSQNNLGFLRMNGTLGRGATSYHQATGIGSDLDNVIVADEGNYRYKRINVSTLGIVGAIDVDYNTIGDTSLVIDENFIYSAYNKISEQSQNHQEVILEKRFKGNMDVVNRIAVLPKNSVALSTYALQGDIALRGRYLYIPFTDNALGNSPTYYIQKRLKSNLNLVSEFIPTREIFSIIGDGYSYIPMIKNEKIDLGVDGKYLQLKYYDSGLDNNVKLINQTFLISPETLKY